MRAKGVGIEKVPFGQAASKLNKAVISIIDKLTKKDIPSITFKGPVYRMHPEKYPDTAWKIDKYNIDTDHRYSAKGSGALYTSTSAEAAALEAGGGKVSKGLPRVLVQVEITVDKIVDLTDPSVLSKFGIQTSELVGDNVSITQQLGDLPKTTTTTNEILKQAEVSKTTKPNTTNETANQNNTSPKVKPNETANKSFEQLQEEFNRTIEFWEKGILSEVFDAETVSKIAREWTRNPQSDNIMLGSGDKFIARAKAKGSSYFDSEGQYFGIKNNIDARATFQKDQMMRINYKFIDNAIANGKKIYASNDPGNPTSQTFRLEVKYLETKGYKLRVIEPGKLWEFYK